MTAIAFENIELIPGYTAIERIGSGGYGEVWRVEAPGGLEKAIKIVHGYHDDERARRELKALERIRRVRHPFLLSVERAEIVDGRLAILTELAEMSLEQRFEQYSIEGLCGIPRDELLGYLRDAADALDYLLQQHQLQHLDIKPENLLLAAGHVKVADFGLVKSVSDSAQHVIGEGLTPMYAAPEVFDGQASPYSDQYSLAIVFHEMLTGALPFPGRTTAQLALQHAQFPPMLQALPVSDREVVAKALAKSPVGRFKSCCEFVEALIGRRPAGVAASTRASEGVGSTDGENLHPDEPPAKRARETDACAAAAPGEARADATMRMEQQACIRVRSDIVNAIVPDVDAQDAGFRPTLYVGIGEVGTRTLCGLRERLDRELPRNWSRVVQMVAVDTDRSTLQAAECGLWGGRLAQDETLWLGLRRAQQYRSDSPSQLRWLSRRWLYNIPQSLLTRGLRPLGRLALVDHAENLLRTLRERLKTFDDSKRIQEFMDRWGIPCRNRRPRVVLIASTNGGTGGGMVVDLAFALQHISAQLGWQEVEILGLLTHLTGSQKKQNDRALANAYSMLSELVTIQSHGYRGKREPSASTAAFEGDQLPFSSMYFVHLGDNLGEHQMEEALAGLADYLSVDATTTAGAALDGIRMRDQEACGDLSTDVRLRALTVRRVHRKSARLMADAARMVRQEVVRLWLDKKVRNKRGPSDSVPPSTVPTQLVPVRGLQEPVVSSDSGGSEQHDNPDLQCLLAKMRVAFADLHESWLAKDLESILKSRLDTCRRRDGTGKSQAAVTRMMALIERVAADQRALVEWTPGPQVAGDDCVGTRPLKGFGPGDESAAFAAWIAEGNLQRYESNFGAMLPDYLVRLEADLLKGQAEAPSLQEVLETTVARLAWQAVEEFKLRRRRQGDLANGRLARAVSDAQERALIRPAGCGHTRYSMLFVPPEEFTALNDTLKCHPVSSKVFPTNATASFVLCEAERLSLAQIAHTLVESRPDLVDTARRYHVRNDIDWQILPCIMSNADKLDTQVR